jgi:hypothetical protein
MAINGKIIYNSTGFTSYHAGILTISTDNLTAGIKYPISILHAEGLSPNLLAIISIQYSSDNVTFTTISDTMRSLCSST